MSSQISHLQPRFHQYKTGFTIIEVALVLAIAAVIFAVVFLAVPAVQRAQRDQLRRKQVDSFLIEFQTYSANNYRKIGVTYGEVWRKELIASFQANYADLIRANDLKIVFESGEGGIPGLGPSGQDDYVPDYAYDTLYFEDGGKCGEHGAILNDDSRGRKNLVMAMMMEQGGGNAYCRDTY
jgi:prepilin-type N-terminal cleavage/methylation domain-containing protein